MFKHSWKDSVVILCTVFEGSRGCSLLYRAPACDGPVVLLVDEA